MSPVLLMLAFLGGVAAQTQQSSLALGVLSAHGVWGVWAVAVAACWLCGGWLVRASRRVGVGRARTAVGTLLALSLAAAGWATTQLRAQSRWDQQWPSAEVGFPPVVWLQGEVASVGPVSQGQRLLKVRVGHVQVGADAEPGVRRWQAGGLWQWPGMPPESTCPRWVGLAVSDKEVVAGEVWRWPATLHGPVAVLNPLGFDLQRWLFEEGIRAQGREDKGSFAGTGERLRPAGWTAAFWVERWRQGLRERIAAAGLDDRTRGLVLGLTVGDQGAIAPADWDTLRDTGLAHIAAISGVHITMMAWLAGGLCGAAWRRSSALMHALPAPVAARVCGLGAAWLYALLAGWGIPAQRTVLMLAVVTGLRARGLRWPAPMVLAVSAVAVALLDPWSLGQAGFWLSFAAVALLMLAGDGTPLAVPREVLQAGVEGVRQAEGARRRVPARPEPGRRGWRRAVGWLQQEGQAAWRGQWLASVGLAPLSLVFFQQVSGVGLLANLLAVPLFSLWITPVSLLGLAWPPLWRWLPPVSDSLFALLQSLALWHGAVLSVPAVTPVWTGLALLGGAWAMAPLPWRWRLWGAPALACLLWPPSFAQSWPAPPVGHFEVHAVDVGQGSAVLVRTGRHTLLFDTGPQTSPGQDAGRRTLLGLLRGMGIGRLDLLALSHGDLDHIGGAASVLQGMAVETLRSSLPSDHGLRATPDRRGRLPPHEPCVAGQGWQWDGVQFEWIHPGASALAEHAERQERPGNAVSCVLRVSEASGARHSLLLTADAEKPQEAWMLAHGALRLQAEVLVVPHHGSATSSTAPFIEAVSPQLAIVQAGARNRYGHPAPEVVQRYARLGVPMRMSPACGDWYWRSAEGPALRFGHCWRETAHRYWHGPLEATRP